MKWDRAHSGHSHSDDIHRHTSRLEPSGTLLLTLSLLFVNVIHACAGKCSRLVVYLLSCVWRRLLKPKLKGSFDEMEIWFMRLTYFLLHYKCANTQLVLKLITAWLSCCDLKGRLFLFLLCGTCKCAGMSRLLVLNLLRLWTSAHKKEQCKNTVILYFIYLFH